MSILDSILRVVDARIAKLDTHALYEGEVVKQTSDGLLEVKLDDDRFGDGFQHLEIAFGIPGVTVEVPKGTRVAVGFHDGKRDMPIVRHWLSGRPRIVRLGVSELVRIESDEDMELDAENEVTVGASATKTSLGPSPRLFAARFSDAVVCGGFGGTIVGGSSKVEVGGALLPSLPRFAPGFSLPLRAVR